MPWTSKSGVSIHYAVSGQGPVLVLLHELGGSLRSWRDLISNLPSGIRFLAYDLRGAGLSEKIRESYSLDDQVTDLQAVLDAVEIQSKVWFVTAAAGTPIALKFAEDHPERVAGLICCSPSVGVDAARRAYLLDRSALAKQDGMKGIIEAALAKSFPRERIKDADVYQEYRARFLANDPIAYGLANLSLAEADTENLGTKIVSPCLLLAGRQDILRPPASVAVLARRIPGARMEVLESGHFMHVESPQIVAARILAFMKENGVQIAPAELASTRVGSELFVQVNQLRFRCLIEGRPRSPWMVFSNSLATNLSLWDEVAAAFAPEFRILRYDQRGHGLTDVPSQPCTFDELAEDAVELMEGCGVRDAIFVGVSMGAVTGLRVAQRFPALLRAVVACDGQPSSPAFNVAIWEQRIEQARSFGMSSLVEPTIERWFPASFRATPSPSLEDVREMIRTTPVEGYVANAQALLSYDMRKEFAAIQIPTLLLAGDEDGVLPEAMRTLHQEMPTSSYIEIPGAGHLPNVQNPQAVVSSIRQFLASLPEYEGENS